MKSTKVSFAKQVKGNMFVELDIELDEKELTPQPTVTDRPLEVKGKIEAMVDDFVPLVVEMKRNRRHSSLELGFIPPAASGQ